MNRQPLVLVVEDNPINQELVRALLEREGYRAEVADDAVAALACLEAELPQLILMDVHLPGQDGLSLTRQLRRGSETANIPIVALTADAMPGDLDACLDAGCAAYISKPIDTRNFAEHVRSFLRTA